MTSTLAPVRFAGQVPVSDGAPTRSAKAAEVLAKVDAGEMSVEEASALRLKDIKELVLGVSANRLQRDPNQSTALDFLRMVSAVGASPLNVVEAAHAKGWAVLEKEGLANGPLNSKLWDSVLVGELVRAMPAVPKQNLGEASAVVFRLAQDAPEMPQDRRGYSVTDRAVGDFLDRKWELLGEVTTDEFRGDIERAIEVAPRSAMWLRANASDGPHMTRENFERASELLAADPKSELQSKMSRDRAPLDWVSFDESIARVRECPIRIGLLCDFAGATTQHTQIVLDRVLARDFDRYDKHMGLERITELPHLQSVVSNSQWMLDLCKKPLDDSAWLVRTLAAEHIDPSTGHALLLQAARATVAAGQRSEALGGEGRIGIALATVIELVGKKDGLAADSSASLSAKEAAQLIVESGIKSDPRDWQWRDRVERAVKDEQLDKSERDALLSGLVQMRMIPIENLPKADQRVSVLGDAIRNNPSRLAEVTDFNIFKRLARQLDIAIEVPAEDVARERRDQALVAISEALPSKAARPR